MNRPLLARYGAQDNRHALLNWEGHPAEPPADLLGLTDKPPGSYAPGDRWWPSVGCGPVEGWWALWWTQPDDQVRRGGMVRSEVALWRLDEVGAVDDLRPVMESLGGQGSILLSSTELLVAVAEALLSENGRRPILRDLEMWPGVIAALWTRLWPEARRAFSARVAVSPPQGGESIAPPWLYGVPSDRGLQWSGYRMITTAPGPTQFSRAAGWLVGEADPTLDEVLTACPVLTADLGGLRRAARAADRLEHLREVREPQRALDLLRPLLALAPAPNAAAALKDEALDALERGLAEGPSSLVLSLTNIDIACLPPGGSLEHSLKGWINHRAPDLPLDEASQLLERLSPDKAESWWRQTVHSSLFAGLANPEPRWAKAAVRWLGLSGSAEALRDLLPTTKTVEQLLLNVTSGVELTKAALSRLRQQATDRKWSRLHAWAVMQELSPQEAFRAQRAFPGDPYTGLTLLVERLPGATILEETISRPDAQLTRLTARRTAQEPKLLGQLDSSKPAWRALWAAHVMAGGVCWPPGVNRDVVGRGLLDAILVGDEPDGLVAALAGSLADTVLHHPERASLWDALSTSGRAALLPQVAEALVGRCDAGHAVSIIERQLGEAVVIRARRIPPSARVFAALLTWGVQLDEQDAIRWLNGPRPAEWAPVAGALGRAVLARGWKQAAKEIYSRCRHLAELRPAAEACQELLSGWERWWLSWTGTPGTFSDSENAPLIERVAELGANLASDRLEYLWERAGGERKRLRTSGSPDVRWRDATMLAQKGALQGGLVALVRQLREDWPHNDDLKELEAMLVTRR